MKHIKLFENFLETMQFSVLTNAQRLYKQEADRKDRKDKQETPKTIDTNNDYYDQEGGEGMEDYDQEGDEGMED
jgi:hypothetical protein